MIRQAIANWINAKTEKLRHCHEWKQVDTATTYKPAPAEMRPQSRTVLYVCSCGAFTKTTLP